jgi:hypothetical protein
VAQETILSHQEEIKRLLLNILQMGILRIRAFGRDDFADRCAIEADHIHNLPGLVRNPRPELLRYYWDIERPAFIKKVPDSDAFEADWLRLGQILAEMRVDTEEA